MSPDPALDPAPDAARDRLPADDHVHSEWSWDTELGAMDATCRRALELDLPSVAFTEHADFGSWVVPAGAELPEAWSHLHRGGMLTPPRLDVAGYLECVEACRERYPSLRILTGVELSEPHWHADDVDALLASGPFDRVLASVHSAPVEGGGVTELSQRYDVEAPHDVLRGYLGEVLRLVTGSAVFEVLAHVDYAVRGWPSSVPYVPEDFEDDYRTVLRALADSGRTLEVNTKVPLHPQVLSWWRDERGATLSFASDAHEPGLLARGFREASAVARAAGFRPGRDPHDFWVRD